MRASTLLNGAYTLSLFIDRYIGSGTLTMVAGDGRGHDGVYQVEVHVRGQGDAVRGIVNVLLTAETAHACDVPRHFSLDVIGSGSERSFNLIGTGPAGHLVELDAQWREELAPSWRPEWP